MPYGLQTFNADGTVDLDTSSRAGRLLGTVSVSNTTSTQLITIPRATGEKCFVTGISGPSATYVSFGLVTYNSSDGKYYYDPNSNLLYINSYAPVGATGGGAIIFYGVY